MANDRYKIVDDSHPYFVTATVKDWYPVFNKKPYARIILDSLAFLQSEGLEIYAYVIMDTHLHLLVKADGLIKKLQRFKSFTAKAVLKEMAVRKNEYALQWLSNDNKQRNIKHEFWIKSGHPEMIQNHEMMRQKINYIHYNPVRKEWVEKAEDWEYSSAGDYNGRSGPLKIVTEW